MHLLHRSMCLPRKAPSGRLPSSTFSLWKRSHLPLISHPSLLDLQPLRTDALMKRRQTDPGTLTVWVCLGALSWHEKHWKAATPESTRPLFHCSVRQGFPGGSAGKESSWETGGRGLTPVSGRSPAEGNGYSLQYSCLEKTMDWGAWRATVHGITESDTIEQLKLRFKLGLRRWF